MHTHAMACMWTTFRSSFSFCAMEFQTLNSGLPHLAHWAISLTLIFFCFLFFPVLEIEPCEHWVRVPPPSHNLNSLRVWCKSLPFRDRESMWQGIRGDSRLIIPALRRRRSEGCHEYETRSAWVIEQDPFSTDKHLRFVCKWYDRKQGNVGWDINKIGCELKLC